MLDRQISNKFANMSVLGAFFVCLQHTALYGVGTDSFLRWFDILAVKGICRVAVPYFFLCSGFFLAGHIKEEGWWKRETLKRVRTIVIPLLAWNALMWLWNTLPLMMGNIVHHREFFESVDFSLITILRAICVFPFDQPYHGVLWFLVSLFCIVIYSPAIAKVCRIKTIVMFWLLYAALLCSGVKLTESVWFIFHQGFVSIVGLTFFTLGMYLRLNDIPLLLSKKIGLSFVIGGLILLVVFAVLQVKVPSLAPVGNWFCLPIWMVSLWYLTPCRGVVKILSGNTFPIYIVHMFSLSFLAIVYSLFHKSLCPITSVSEFVLVAIFAFTSSLVVAVTIKRFLRSSAKILFGGRE